jgi:hypothetical protein
MTKDRRSRDQKRKEKLAKDRHRSKQSQSLAYFGKRYKTDELVRTLMMAEVGIYEAYRITERKLLDQTVKSALETLIRQMRAETLPPPSDLEVKYEVGQDRDLVIESIRRSWAKHFATEGEQSKEDRVGILRTILGSLERMRIPAPDSQSYLRHIARFLTGQLGVVVDVQ